MQLIFQMQNESTCVAWSQYALLRDNVQHYLESGPGQPPFIALHAVERAVDGDIGNLDAFALRAELDRAWSGLGSIKLSESAISLRTRAILMGCKRPPLVRGTVLAKLSGWELPVTGEDGQPLRDYLIGFVQSVLALTAKATPSDDVYVKRQQP